MDDVPQAGVFDVDVGVVSDDIGKTVGLHASAANFGQLFGLDREGNYFLAMLFNFLRNATLGGKRNIGDAIAQPAEIGGCGGFADAAEPQQNDVRFVDGIQSPTVIVLHGVFPGVNAIEVVLVMRVD